MSEALKRPNCECEKKAERTHISHPRSPLRVGNVASDGDLQQVLDKLQSHFAGNADQPHRGLQLLFSLVGNLGR